MKKPIRYTRVLMAIPGFDGHWRGAMTVTKALRDAGMEVIYVGQQQPEAICEIAVQENVDFIGLSIFSAGYMRLIPRILEGLRKRHADNILILVGGIIIPQDVEKLKEMGVAEIFLSGCRTASIVDFINAKVGAALQ